MEDKRCDARICFGTRVCQAASQVLTEQVGSFPCEWKEPDESDAAKLWVGSDATMKAHLDKHGVFGEAEKLIASDGFYPTWLTQDYWINPDGSA